jgi:hypothetical protein
MGIIIKTLANVEFETNKMGYMEIELNEGPVIHLQNEFFRIEMNPEEYVQFAVNVINGANKLIEMKGLDGTNT